MRKHRFGSQSSQDRIDEILPVIEERIDQILAAEAKGDNDKLVILNRQLDGWIDIIKSVYRAKHKGKYSNAK